MSLRLRPYFLLCVLLLAVPVHAELYQWKMDDSYNGPYKDTALRLKYDINSLMRNTMIDVATRCGLDFQDGWQHPLFVRFVDDAPGGTENILAYVQEGRTQEGAFVQMLSVNLRAYEREQFNFPKVFAHELVHAMLNDGLAEKAEQVPVWFHEGLAVYASNQGESLMQSYVFRYPDQNVDFFINGLEGNHGAVDYLEDYLAFKYIAEKKGGTSLRNFIREITARGGDIPGAYQYTCYEPWAKFLTNAKSYAEEQIAELRRTTRGLSTIPGKAY